MDYNDFLSKIQNDVNKRTQEILDQCQRNTDVYSNSRKMECLKRDSRLENATRTKIGTFEKLYQGTYESDSGIPMYGYDDLDYASLVNLLATALEIELNMSLYQSVRKEAGIEMPANAWKDCGHKDIYVSGRAVNVGKASQMYGALIDLFRKFRDTTAVIVGNPDEFLKSLEKIANVRNRASHKDMIGSSEFVAFYSEYASLFNGYISRLMDLKVSFRRSPSDYSAITYGNYVKYDSASDDYIQGLKKATSARRKVQSGIIFTDTRKLALKYYGQDKVRQDDAVYSASAGIRNALVEYARKMEQYGNHYSVLDLGTGEYDYILDVRNDIHAYLDILDNVCDRYGVSKDSPHALFIIGGQDVIPMGRFHNPGQIPEEEAIDSNAQDNTVDTDLPYAYPSKATRLTPKGDFSLDALVGYMNNPRFMVGRLPLENGYMKTSFDDDVLSYLNRSLKAYSDGGMEIKSTLMTTCRNAVNVGSFMIQDIPVQTHDDSPEDLAVNDMITSPSLSLENNPDAGYTKNGVSTFSSKVSQADMLVFLLHGSGKPSSSHYYGDYTDEHGCRVQPIAFSPEILSYGCIKNIATVSCFGAKFIDYDRKTSTLLSAIYKDTLCFMGSSRSAYGDFDDTLESVRKEESDVLPRFSVRLMNYYLHLLFSGIPGGEALSRAKIKYIEGVLSGKFMEAIPQGLTTVLEFNFFGDPTLYMQPRITVPERFSSKPVDIPEYRCDGDAWVNEYEAMAIPGSESGEGLLGHIRGLVDYSFKQIHAAITEKLYKEMGIPPRELLTVNKFKSKDGKSGYNFCYRHKSGDLASDTIVTTDLSGKISDIYYTY